MSAADRPTLPAIALPGVVVLPSMALTLPVSDAAGAAAVDEAVRGDHLALLVPAHPDAEDRSLAERLLPVGVVARIERVSHGGPAERGVLIRALHRAVLGQLVQDDPCLRFTYEARPDPQTWPPEVEQLRLRVLAAIELFVSRQPGIPQEVLNFVRGISHPGQLADSAGYAPEMSFAERADLLQTVDLAERLQKVLAFFQRQIQLQELKEEIRSRVREAVEKTQREYILREQLQAIRRELGEEDDGAAEIERYRQRIEASGMPEEARREALRELARLERLPPQAAEYSVIKTYLEWLVDLPWQRSDPEEIDIARARAVLDEDHYDLGEVKERILEHLAVRKLRAERGTGGADGPVILCFVGPPGVGKTSLGQSIARALGRKFTRMSLGGIRDEAEIRGHRRTYVGAMPGRIIQAIRRAGTNNPVFMLDEVDKIGADWRGDPAAALLEVLDPAQNAHFRDHYLDVDFDLSRVMFITTANLLDPIPPALRDRMEVLHLDGYTEHDKIHIARGFLLPRQRALSGLREEEVAFTDDAVRAIIRDYTREAGVRQLEREIGRVLRKVATAVADGRLAPPVLVDAARVPDYLGVPRFASELAERTGRPGVATGLAVTPTGGEAIFVEAARMPGEERLTLTGHLGEVMKESAQIALSYVRSAGPALGVDPGRLRGHEVHIHVPAGATPKDGPSAGVAMVAALVSLLSGRPVRADVAMTGEITLQGQVLPVGGIRQKLLAAQQAGLRTVILPARNAAEMREIPEEVRAQLEVRFVRTIEEALAIALQPEPVAVT
ncbi:MAG: endopeptidase La [Armatimonadota bacterium]|nr:endopeptidase La [Armatimonadota bacterium]MDR7437013.1 endopeptidase La [Armatimonadota bacterium]MDR7472916.1 endopeptidase La [Armatimonadota bacterium]MDR7507680.1 endopeptidase La [Armatimonadota bacterium]MDR7508899.1 endopeptidase La [Armatimonadota bacterium]